MGAEELNIKIKSIKLNFIKSFIEYRKICLHFLMRYRKKCKRRATYKAALLLPFFSYLFLTFLLSCFLSLNIANCKCSTNSYNSSKSYKPILPCTAITSHRHLKCRIICDFKETFVKIPFS